MTDNRRRIDRILSPEYVEDLDRRNLDDLRERRRECTDLETEISYLRRLAQGRIDILSAELERRAAGGSLGDLIAALPQILADDQRPAPAASHLPTQLAPRGDIEFNRGLERLVTDATLANLPSIPDDELRHTLEMLREFEGEVSSARRSLHTVLDSIDREVATRQAVEQH